MAAFQREKSGVVFQKSSMHSAFIKALEMAVNKKKKILSDDTDFSDWENSEMLRLKTQPIETANIIRQ